MSACSHQIQVRLVRVITFLEDTFSIDWCDLLKFCTGFPLFVVAGICLMYKSEGDVWFFDCKMWATIDATNLPKQIWESCKFNSNHKLFFLFVYLIGGIRACSILFGMKYMFLTMTISSLPFFWLYYVSMPRNELCWLHTRYFNGFQRKATLPQSKSQLPQCRMHQQHLRRRQHCAHEGVKWCLGNDINSNTSTLAGRYKRWGKLPPWKRQRWDDYLYLTEWFILW